MSGRADSLASLSGEQRRRLVERALRDPEAQRELVGRVREAVDDVRRSARPGERGAFDRMVAEVAAALPEGTPSAELGARYLRGEVDRAAALADPMVRSAVSERLRERVASLRPDA